MATHLGNLGEALAEMDYKKGRADPRSGSDALKALGFIWDLHSKHDFQEGLGLSGCVQSGAWSL